jgi:hypothetical protein
MKNFKQLEIPFKENVKNLYWHPYELRHYFRNYYSSNFKSYNRLGLIIQNNGLNLSNELILENTKYYHKLNKILDLIALHIPMNLKIRTLKPSRINSYNNCTLKKVYKTRQEFRKVLKYWAS